MTDTKLDALKPTAPTATSIGGYTPMTVANTVFNYNMLVFGDFSVGKTVFAGSAIEVADLSPVLFLDVEGGTLSLSKMYPSVEVIRITEPKQITEIWKDLRKGNHPYKTIVVDSLTELHKLIIRYIMLQVMDDDDKGNRDEDVPSMREYLKATEQVRRICRRYRDLPVNSVFTALLTDEIDDKKNKTYKKINLSRKLAGEVGGFFDEVFYMYVKDIKKTVEGKEVKVPTRMMLTARTDEIGAKDRSQTLPTVVVEPTMEMIFEYFTGVRDNSEQGKEE